LATPWDFHAERRGEAELLGRAAAAIGETLPVEAIQTLFFALDPLLAERKFRRFAALDPAGEEAEVFVALEDWINDGVPLAGPAARDCFASWYGANDPAAGRWRVAGMAVEPAAFEGPALAVVPSRDRIVPPGSAAALAAALPRATVLRPPLGHIGMMAGHAAQTALWPKIAGWLAGF
jgi:polyhydroxyalkanoate synthase